MCARRSARTEEEPRPTAVGRVASAACVWVCVWCDVVLAGRHPPNPPKWGSRGGWLFPVLLGPSLDCDAAHYVCFATTLARAIFQKGHVSAPPNPTRIASRVICVAVGCAPRRSQPPRFFLWGAGGRDQAPPIFVRGLVPLCPVAPNTFEWRLGPCGAWGIHSPASPNILKGLLRLEGISGGLMKVIS